MSWQIIPSRNSNAGRSRKRSFFASKKITRHLTEIASTLLEKDPGKTRDSLLELNENL
jgi:hypothetical protein